MLDWASDSLIEAGKQCSVLSFSRLFLLAQFALVGLFALVPSRSVSFPFSFLSCLLLLSSSNSTSEFLSFHYF
jgi:hypothetical protein